MESCDLFFCVPFLRSLAMIPIDIVSDNQCFFLPCFLIFLTVCPMEIGVCAVRPMVY